MDNLTVTEKKLFNNLSQVLNPVVKLGDKIEEIISLVGETGTPVNAVNATATLNITGVYVDGETLTIRSDVYEFLSDDAQSKTDPNNIGIDITDVTVKASGTLTVDTQPTSGDTLTIGSKTYIFVPNGTDNFDGEISIGTDLATSQVAIVSAINGTDGHNSPNLYASAGDFSANDSVITAFIGGTIGNSIVTTETFTAETNVFAAGTLESGTDCTDVNTVSKIITAITNNDTEGVGATDAGGNSITLTADAAGVLGNSITLSKTMTNSNFTDDVTNLIGGINGTVVEGTKFMIDTSYLYVRVNGNTVSGKNWRRVSIGSAY